MIMMMILLLFIMMMMMMNMIMIKLPIMCREATKGTNRYQTGPIVPKGQNRVLFWGLIGPSLDYHTVLGSQPLSRTLKMLRMP